MVAIETNVCERSKLASMAALSRPIFLSVLRGLHESRSVRLQTHIPSSHTPSY
jgi:hypothetical protein